LLYIESLKTQGLRIFSVGYIYAVACLDFMSSLYH